MQPTALVTGASGFIGSTLIQSLTESGVRVFALMRKTSSAQNLKDLKVEVLQGDVTDLSSLQEAMRELKTKTPELTWVYHLAGVIAAPSNAAFFSAHVDGAKNLAEALIEAEIPVRKRFVAMSSLSAAGPSPDGVPLAESMTPRPVSAYGQSKLASEQALLSYRDRFPLVFIRPPMVYGPKDRGVFLLVRTVAQRVIPLLPTEGGGSKRLSVIHVSDLVRGMILAANQELRSSTVQSGEVFFLAEDRIYTDREILRVLSQALGVKAITFSIPKWLLVALAHLAGWLAKFTGRHSLLNPDKLNEMLPAAWICSNVKAKSELGFIPQVSMESGMTETVGWYRENGWL